jgi:protein phosphatase
VLRVVDEAYRTDTGRQRTANEDSLYARAPIFAVADGMGGAQAGEVASRIAAESFEPAARSGESPEAFLRAIAESANERIHDLASRDETRSGMGTTLTAAIVEGEEVSIAHVGDSRAYVFRDGELRMLTADHSLVEELRRQGRLTEEQAEDHPQRSIITRALGPEAEVEVDTMTYRARPGDVYLICSDGLTTMVRDEEIAAILGETPSLDEMVSRLVREANEAGGRDNITVVAFRLEEADQPAVEEGATLVGPSAADAGLSGERVRAEGAPRRARTVASGTSAGRAAPDQPRRSRLRVVAKALLGLAIVAALCAAAWIGIRQVHFLGTDEGGRLALYRGLPYDLPLEVSLYSEVTSVPVQVDSLPEDRRDEATNHELRSEDDARSLLSDLERAVSPATPPAKPEPKPAPEPRQGDGKTGGRRPGDGRPAGRRDGPRGDNG